jgi:hypothetical protein
MVSSLKRFANPIRSGGWGTLEPVWRGLTPSALSANIVIASHLFVEERCVLWEKGNERTIGL